jgi:hypothetical protein
MRSKFKKEHEFAKRKAEAERIRARYTDRIPVTLHYFIVLLIIDPANPCSGHLRED